MSNIPGVANPFLIGRELSKAFSVSSHHIPDWMEDVREAGDPGLQGDAVCTVQLSPAGCGLHAAGGRADLSLSERGIGHWDRCGSVIRNLFFGFVLQFVMFSFLQQIGWSEGGHFQRGKIVGVFLEILMIISLHGHLSGSKPPSTPSVRAGPCAWADQKAEAAGPCLPTRWRSAVRSAGSQTITTVSQSTFLFTPDVPTQARH